MDEKAFSHLESSSYDIITVYNYTSLKHQFCRDFNCRSAEMHSGCPLYKIFNQYKEINIIAYGSGVWAASLIFSYYLKHLATISRFRVLRLMKKFNRSVAINGTLCPVSNIWGIKQRLFNGTLAALKEEVVEKKLTYGSSVCMQKFNMQMFDTEKDAYERYLKVLPQRGLEDIYNELLSFKKNFVFSNAISWNKVLIGSRDNIIPPKNQERFWTEYAMSIDKENKMSFNAKDFSIELIDAPHFPFFKWSSWDEIL